MASIAAVAQVTLVSRTKDGDAFSIQVDGGAIGDVLPTSASIGTTVTVNNLFYHTPARLKFLKSVKSETRDITALIEKVMIANPTLAIRYFVDGKVVYESSGAGLDEVIKVLYDDDLVSHLIPINADEYGYQVKGYVSDTLFSRGTRTVQTTVVNGRVISNQQLTGALNNAYRDYLMKHCYPVLILHITVPFDEVDVNVHPTKADVRFVYANKLFGFVYRAVKRALDEDLNQGALFFDGVQQQADQSTPSEHHWDLDFDSSKVQSEPIVEPKQTFSQVQVAEDNDLLNDLLACAKSTTLSKPTAPSNPTPKPVQTTMQSVDLSDKKVLDPIKIVGQVLGTYIVAEYQGDMLLIDQHAAAERVMYDQLVEQYTSGDLAVQPLLLPYDFNLMPQEAEMLESRIDLLKSIGVEIVANGEDSFSLVALPAMLTEMDVDEFVKRILALDPDKNLDLVKERLAYAACRSALKGNTYMDADGLKYIVDRLFGERIPRQCPHGRPAYVRITKAELDKMFKRIV